MALKVGTLYGLLKLDDSQFMSALSRVEDKLKLIAERAEASARKIEESLGSRAVDASSRLASKLKWLAFAMAGVSAAGIKLAADMEQARIAFTTMLGSAQEADRFLRELADFANKTPFEFAGLVDASRKLMAYGISAEFVLPIMQTIGDTIAAMGGGAAEIDRFVLAIGQMAAKGKAAGEEMRQLTELGIPAWELLAEKIGVSIPEAMEKVSEGAVSAGEVITAVLEGLDERFRGMMDEQSQTLAGMFATMKDTATATLRTIGESLIETFDLKEKLRGVVDWLSAFAEIVQESGVREALSQLIPPGLKVAIIGVSGALVGALVPSLMKTALAAKAALLPLLPFIVKGAAIALAAYLIYKNWKTVADFFESSFKTAIERVTNWLKKHEGTIKSTAAVLLTIFGPALIKSAATAVVSGAKIAGTFVMSLLKASGAATVTAATTIKELIPALLKTAAAALKTAAIFIKDLVLAIVKYAASGWGAVASALAHVAAMVAQKTAMLAVAAATKVVTAAQWLWNAAMAANPIGAVIAAIAILIGVIALLIMHWKEVINWTKNVWGALKTLLVDRLGKVGEFVVNTVEKMRNAFSRLWQTITGGTSKAVDKAKDKFKDFGKKVKDSISKQFTLNLDLDKSMKDYDTDIKKVLEDLQKSIDKHGVSLGDAAKKGRQKGVREVKTYAQQVKEILAELAKELTFSIKMEAVFKEEFDLNRAKADAYYQAIVDLLKAGASEADKQVRALYSSWSRVMKEIASGEAGKAAREQSKEFISEAKRMQKEIEQAGKTEIEKLINDMEYWAKTVDRNNAELRQWIENLKKLNAEQKALELQQKRDELLAEAKERILVLLKKEKSDLEKLAEQLEEHAKQNTAAGESLKFRAAAMREMAKSIELLEKVQESRAEAEDVASEAQKRLTEWQNRHLDENDRLILSIGEVIQQQLKKREVINQEISKLKQWIAEQENLLDSNEAVKKQRQEDIDARKEELKLWEKEQENNDAAIAQLKDLTKGLERLKEEQRQARINEIYKELFDAMEEARFAAEVLNEEVDMQEVKVNALKTALKKLREEGFDANSEAIQNLKKQLDGLTLTPVEELLKDAEKALWNNILIGETLDDARFTLERNLDVIDDLIQKLAVLNTEEAKQFIAALKASKEQLEDEIRVLDANEKAVESLEEAKKKLSDIMFDIENRERELQGKTAKTRNEWKEYADTLRKQASEATGQARKDLEDIADVLEEAGNRLEELTDRVKLYQEAQKALSDAERQVIDLQRQLNDILGIKGKSAWQEYIEGLEKAVAENPEFANALSESGKSVKELIEEIKALGQELDALGDIKKFSEIDKLIDDMVTKNKQLLQELRGQAPETKEEWEEVLEALKSIDTTELSEKARKAIEARIAAIEKEGPVLKQRTEAQKLYTEALKELQKLQEKYDDQIGNKTVPEWKKLVAILEEAIERNPELAAATTETGESFAEVISRIKELGEAIDKIEDLKEAMDKLKQIVRDVGTILKTVFGANSDIEQGIQNLVDGITSVIEAFVKFKTGDLLGAVASMVEAISKIDQGLADLVPSMRKAREEGQQLAQAMDDILNLMKEFGDESLVGISKSAADAMRVLEQERAKAEQQANAGFFKRLWWGITNTAPKAMDEAARKAKEVFIKRFAAIGKAISTGVTSAFQTGIRDFLSGTGGILNALRTGIRDAIANAIAEAVIQGALIKGALGSLLTELTDTLAAGGDATGVIARIGAVVPDVAAQLEEILLPLRNALRDSIPGLASGGIITRSGLTLVGERGPELLNLPRGASVIPLDKAASGPSTQTIAIYLDGRAIAKQTVKNMPRILTLHGITR